LQPKTVKKQLLGLTLPYFIVFSLIIVKKQLIFFINVEVGIPKFKMLAPPLRRRRSRDNDGWRRDAREAGVSQPVGWQAAAMERSGHE
jgi:hypothetical protein